MVEIRLPARLRQAHQIPTPLSLPGADLQQVLQQLFEQYPSLQKQLMLNDQLNDFTRVFINQQLTDSLETPLQAGDTIDFIQAMAGG